MYKYIARRYVEEIESETKQIQANNRMSQSEWHFHDYATARHIKLFFAYVFLSIWHRFIFRDIQPFIVLLLFRRVFSSFENEKKNKK